MSDLTPILAWTFLEEISTPTTVHELLVEGEKPVCSYRTLRETATITNKRTIRSAWDRRVYAETGDRDRLNFADMVR